MKKPRYNQNVTVTIQSLGRHGEGIGYWQGYTLFVDGALPQEVVRGRIIQKEKSFGRLEISSIQNSSSMRTAPLCPYFMSCGGCQFQHIFYEDQLEIKKKKVMEAFSKQGVDYETIFPCEPSERKFHYRTKLQLPCKTLDEQLKIGFFAKRSKEFVPIKTCRLHDSLGETLLQKLVQKLNAWGFLGYEEGKSQKGIRFIILRISLHSNQALLLLVTYEDASEKLRKFSQHILENFPEIQGVVHSQNFLDDNRVLGDSFSLLAGQDVIFEKMQNIDFQISAPSFFQVNPIQAEKIFSKAIECAGFQKTDVFLDAFCGVGIFSLLAAPYVSKGIGIESVPLAICDAKATAERYGFHHIEFISGEILQMLHHIPEVQIAFINPPRKGCEEVFLEKLKTFPLRKILYLSCDPTSLARDCKFLSDRFRVQRIFPYDMFPQTSHVETLVELTPL